MTTMGPGKLSRAKRKNHKVPPDQSPVEQHTDEIGGSVRDEVITPSDDLAIAAETGSLTNGHTQNGTEKIEPINDYDPAQISETADPADSHLASVSPLPPLPMETAKSKIEQTLGRMKFAVEQTNLLGSESPIACIDEQAIARDLRAQNYAYEELAKRKAQILAAVRAAEAKAREAEGAFKQIESRLESEIAQRISAEARIREIEEDYAQQIAALET